MAIARFANVERLSLINSSKENKKSFDPCPSAWVLLFRSKLEFRMKQGILITNSFKNLEASGQFPMLLYVFKYRSKRQRGRKLQAPVSQK